MFPSGNSRLLYGIYDASKNNGAGSLDIVIEAGKSMAIPFKRWERVLEILKLDDNAMLYIPLAKIYPTVMD